MIKTSLAFCSCLFVIIFLLYSNPAFGAVYHGLIYAEDYYSNDSSSSYDFNFLTTRFRLDAAKLNEAGTLSFHFDGRERNNLGSKDYSSKYHRNERIDTLNLEYTGVEHFYLTAGRLLPREFFIERVDGLNIVFQRMNFGMGLFGGAKPDPYTQEFNPNFTTLGGYIFYRNANSFANLAFTHNGYKGRTDRQYLYGQSSYSPSGALTFYGSITADLNQLTNKLDLTNTLVEVSYRPDFRKSVTFGYNQFKAFRFYKSMDFDIVDSSQHSYYLRGDYRFLEKYTLYGRYEYQTSHYKTLEPANKDSNIYLAGFRNDNLLNLEVNLDVSATVTDGYNSNYNTYNIQASRFFTDMFQLTISSSYMRSKYRLVDYTDKILTYDASGYLIFNRRWSMSLSYEGREAESYTTNTIISRISYKF